MTRVRKGLILLLTAAMLLVSAEGVSAKSLKIPPVRETDRLQKVNTIAWRASLNTNVKTKHGSYPKGTIVKVLRGGSKCKVKLDGHTYRIARKYLTFLNDLANSRKDYNTKTKLHFANKKSRKSKTNYLVWVSLDKQRINIYKGSNKNWTLKKVFKCSTGAENGTPLGDFTIRKKMPSFTGQYGSPLWYYMDFAGSGFHKWPGPIDRKLYGKHTASHGCIRLSLSDISWMYKHLPVTTKVVIY